VPKPGAAIYQSQADAAKRPVIVPAFFWDSRSAPAGPGPGSKFATNCDRLEIFAGGAHLATATPDRVTPKPDAARLWCAPAVPERYLPLQVAGLRIGSSRLTIDVRDDEWHLTGLEETGIELIRQPRYRNSLTQM
jgi:hypothetical protein